MNSLCEMEEANARVRKNLFILFDKPSFPVLATPMFKDANKPHTPRLALGKDAPLVRRRLVFQFVV